jgi:hypothetical protein
MGGSGEGEPKAINSVEELQALGPALLKRVNSDQALAVAAAANPLLALTELGYELAPAVRQDLEERARFSKRQIAQRRKLQGELRRAAGRDVDVADPADLRRLLAEDLMVDADLPRDLSLPIRPSADDPLERLRSAHPAIDPILMLRALEAGAPRFASAERYRALRTGSIKLPALRLTARLATDRRSRDGGRRKRKGRGGA